MQLPPQHLLEPAGHILHGVLQHLHVLLHPQHPKLSDFFFQLLQVLAVDMYHAFILKRDCRDGTACGSFKVIPDKKFSSEKVKIRYTATTDTQEHWTMGNFE